MAKYKYVARIEMKKNKYRMLKKIWNVDSLQEAWLKAKELYPNDKVLSVQLSKRWMEREGNHE